MFQKATDSFRRAVLSARRATVRTVVGGAVLVGTLEVTTHLPSQGRSSAFYHTAADEWITPAMRRLLDPEVAHNVAIQMSKRGLSPRHHPSAIEQQVSVRSKVFGKTFENPIGLGAGFDKDAEIIQPMLDLGFGFVEIGTVTPEAQAGNPKPRMFRLTQDLGIVNRYGFNSQGAAAVEANLQAYRHSPVKKKDPEAGAAWKAMRWLQSTMYPEQHAAGVVGVNIGKNKETEDSAADYVSNITRLGVYADYLVVNISSPNTAGLRELQQADALRSLLQACLKARDALEVPVPLLVKLAPDLTEDDLQEIANVLLSLEIDGIVVTNTTKERPRDLISKHRGEIGGLSGAPVKDKSTEVIRQLFRLTRGKIPIIGVGGVGTGHDAYVKLKAGASLVQVYSMMVYKGPGLVSQIRHELAKLMLQNGQRSIEDVVGSDPCHEDIFWKKKQAAGVQKVQEMEETFAINQ